MNFSKRSTSYPIDLHDHALQTRMSVRKPWPCKTCESNPSSSMEFSNPTSCGWRINYWQIQFSSRKNLVLTSFLQNAQNIIFIWKMTCMTRYNCRQSLCSNKHIIPISIGYCIIVLQMSCLRCVYHLLLRVSFTLIWFSNWFINWSWVSESWTW